MNIINNSTRIVDLTFFKDGRIDISAYVTKTLGLESGDMVGFAEEDEEYYIFVMKKKDELVGRSKSICHRTRNGKKVCNTLRLYNVDVCRLFMKLCGKDDVLHLRVGSTIENQQYGKCLNIITHEYRN